MSGQTLHVDPEKGFIQVVGVGGIGTGMILALEGDQTLGRNESRLGQMLDARDYCKLHIVEHYIAVLMGAQAQGAFQVFAVGNVGNDQAGENLLKEMRDAGINVRYVNIDPERSTLFSVCFLYPDQSGGNITTSNSAARSLSKDQLEECRDLLAGAGRRGLALCLPEVPLKVRQKFLHIATDCGSYRVASFASSEIENARELGLLSHIDLLALNHEEAAALAGVNFSKPERAHLLDACAAVVHAANPEMKLLVSAGSDGAYIWEAGRWFHHRMVPVKAISTAGAGDALLAGVISGLAAGLPLTQGMDETGNNINAAIDLGLALAGFSVKSPHTIHPEAGLENLLRFVSENSFVINKKTVMSDHLIVAE